MTPNRTLTLLLAAIACALVLLTACGGGSDSTPTPSPTVRATADPNATLSPTSTPASSSVPDVCSLISPASVVTLIGRMTYTTPDSGECDYTGADGNLTVQLETEPTVAAATQKVDVFSPGAEAVSAGDAAFFGGKQIVARKGLHVFVLTTTVQKDNLKDALVALAQSAASSLPAS
jgi:hypothetical protein